MACIIGLLEQIDMHYLNELAESLGIGNMYTGWVIIAIGMMAWAWMIGTYIGTILGNLGY